MWPPRFWRRRTDTSSTTFSAPEDEHATEGNGRQSAPPEHTPSESTPPEHTPSESTPPEHTPLEGTPPVDVDIDDDGNLPLAIADVPHAPAVMSLVQVRIRGIHWECDEVECMQHRWVATGNSSGNATRSAPSRDISLKKMVALCSAAYQGEDMTILADGHLWRVTYIPNMPDDAADDFIDRLVAGRGFTCAAAVCVDDSTPPLRVLAFKGTSSYSDWATNVRYMVTGTSKQHRSAVELARQLRSLHLVIGHSLGGGLAASVSEHLGVRCATINAAPKSFGSTLYGSEPLYRRWALHGGVVNYVLEGDVLDGWVREDHVTASRGLRNVGRYFQHHRIGITIIIQGASTATTPNEIHRLRTMVGFPFHARVDV
jgi:hypothetical protein